MSEYENFNDPTIYLKESTENISTTILSSKFIKLLDTYHVLFMKNILTKDTRYKDFIYTQGMKCLNNIFILLFHYTQNINFTYYHCEKGIYYFTEFISQIENENSFLKLSSIDAIIFVYKKTIYNINKSFVHTTTNNTNIDKRIKLIISINKISFYDDLKAYYPKLLTFKDNISKVEQSLDESKSLDDSKSLKQIRETLKNELG
jgi:hypothetical protein